MFRSCFILTAHKTNQRGGKCVTGEQENDPILTTIATCKGAVSNSPVLVFGSTSYTAIILTVIYVIMTVWVDLGLGGGW